MDKPTQPDADLLDQMATAFDQTAEFIESSPVAEMSRVMAQSGHLPAQASSTMLKFNAAMMRKLASLTRDGKTPVRAERCSTDG